jgi:hypothetical protein
MIQWKRSLGATMAIGLISTGCSVIWAPVLPEETGAGGAGGEGTGGSAPPPPVSIELQGLDQTVQYGNSSGGSPHEDPCPTGQLIIGYQGYFDPSGFPGRLRARCGTPAISGNGPYAVTIPPAGFTPLEGASGDTVWTRYCPPDQAVVGFSGRSNTYLDYLILDCAPLLITGSPGSYLVEIGTATQLMGVGDVTGGSPFSDTGCLPGEVATESHLRTGAVIDAFGLGCSKPVVTH